MKRIFLLVSALTLVTLAIAEILSNNGKAGKTGSPGETTCSGCHTSTDASTSVIISCGNMPNWEYIPGTTYNMSVTVSKQGINLFGLGVEALTSTNQNAGTLVITNSLETQIKNQTVSGVSRINVVHQLGGGASPNSKTFNFDWIAPTSASGNITFYYAAIAANANGGSGAGDFAVNGSQVITAVNTTAVKKNTAQPELSIYPSPISNEFYIDFGNLKQEKIYLQIIDFSGKIVQEENINSNTNSVNKIEINNNIVNGIYFIRTISQNNTTLNKVIIKK